MGEVSERYAVVSRYLNNQTDAEWERLRRLVAARPGELATLSFQPEAYESAAEFFRYLTANGPRVGGWRDESDHGYIVEVVPYMGEQFTAELLNVTVDEESGQYQLELARWSEELGRGDRSDVVTLDLYDDIERIEVC